MSSLRSLLTHHVDALVKVVERPWLDVLVLTEWVSGLRRDDVLASLSQPLLDVLDGNSIAKLDEAVRARASGLPVARITGRREFWGLAMEVGHGVLIPRPESEIVVETVLELLAVGTAGSRASHVRAEYTVLDAYTGSGCIGIATARALISDLPAEARPQSVSLTLLDASAEALEWARRNAITHLDGPDGGPTRWETVVGDGVDAATRVYDLITANPPYLTTDESADIASRGWNEPAMAFDGGGDGLDAYRAIAQAVDRLAPGGYLVVEHGASQREQVCSLLTDGGYRIVGAYNDLAGLPRVVAATI